MATKSVSIRLSLQGGMAGFASRLGPIGSVMMALGPAGLAAGAAIGFFGKAIVESTIKVESLEARLKGLVGAAALSETTSYLYAQAQKTGTALETAVGVVVTVNNHASGTQARAEQSQGADGRIHLDIIVEEIEGRMSRRIGRGEGMAPILEYRYGLNPTAGAYR